MKLRKLDTALTVPPDSNKPGLITVYSVANKYFGSVGVSLYRMAFGAPFHQLPRHRFGMPKILTVKDIEKLLSLNLTHIEIEFETNVDRVKYALENPRHCT